MELRITAASYSVRFHFLYALIFNWYKYMHNFEVKFTKDPLWGFEEKCPHELRISIPGFQFVVLDEG